MMKGVHADAKVEKIFSSRKIEFFFFLLFYNNEGITEKIWIFNQGKMYFVKNVKMQNKKKP